MSESIKELVEIKAGARYTLRRLLGRELVLSELVHIEQAATIEEVKNFVDSIIEMTLPAEEYKAPQVKRYAPKIGHNLTGPSTIPEGTDLKNVEVTGTYNAKDDYANTISLTTNGAGITAFTVSPQFLCLPIFNTMVKIPMNNPILRGEMIERGIDFIADLMEIDGVKEVLEKYGAEIKPL